MKTRALILSFLLLAGLGLSTALSAAPLQPKLDEVSESMKDKLPADKRVIIEKQIDALRKSKIMKTALKKGQKIPSFQLADAKNESVGSDQLLKNGPLIIIFYRGSWCPYCNLQLHAMKENYQDIVSAGGDLVAISPEKPDGSLTTVQKHGIPFHVLSDPGLKVSKKFGLVYKLPDDLKKLYLSFGNDLEKANGTKDWELPMAATYVVDTHGKIVYSFVDADYRKRAEPEDVLNALRNISKK